MQTAAIQKFLEYKNRTEQNKTLSEETLQKILKNRQEAILRKIEFRKRNRSPESVCPSVPERPRSISPPLFPAEEPADLSIPDDHYTVDTELFSKDQVLIKASIFISGGLKKLIQSCAGIYCQDTSGWVIPVKMYTEFKKQLITLQHVKIQKIPDFVVKALSQPFPTYSKKCPHNYAIEPKKTLESVPHYIIEKLYPFQKEGVAFALNHHGRALIGDEMGVGKTVQGIAIAAAYQEEWPVFVLCPASVKLNWRDEFKRWMPFLENKDFYILESKKTMKNAAKVWIASYHMATYLESMLNTKTFNVVIADECHYLKNYNAKRTQCLVPFLQKVKRVVLLSGTPVLSRPAELFTQLSAIRPDIFYSFRVFAERYCDPKLMFNHTDYSGASHIKELHTLLANTVMIRRLKSDVLSQLPAKVRQKVEIGVAQEHCRSIRKLYIEVRRKKRFLKELITTQSDARDAEFASKRMETEMFMTKAYKLTAQAKIKGVCEYVSYLIQSDCKFLVFAHHLEMLDAIEQQVVKEKAKFIRIDGSTSQDRRHKGVQVFQENKECQVAILSILAAGQGITLTAASTVIMAEMTWTPGIMIQAEDRAHRIGQARAVNIHYLYAPNTLDEYIWPRIQNKLNVITRALDDDQNEQLRSLINPECKLGMGDFQADGDIDFDDIFAGDDEEFEEALKKSADIPARIPVTQSDLEECKEFPSVPDSPKLAHPVRKTPQELYFDQLLEDTLPKQCPKPAVSILESRKRLPTDNFKPSGEPPAKAMKYDPYFIPESSEEEL
jgi:superfamily II DNA or RNA helicase